MRTMTLLAAISAVFLLSACGEKPSPAPAPAAQAMGSGAAPGGAAPAGLRSVTGEVVETMDAASYTYARLKTAQGEIWVAGPATPLAVGETVTARDAMAMEGFESRTLGRSFDSILFAAAYVKSGATAAAAPAPAPADPHAGMGMGMVPHGGAEEAGAKQHMKTAPAPVQALPRAEGELGRTIAELYAQAESLAGQKVAVRGHVTKFSAGIMGRNWVHLQDATGEASQGTHDLTVTTQDVVAKGDRVLVQGVLASDKDFGAGYRYAVIVEDASVTVEP